MVVLKVSLPGPSAGRGAFLIEAYCGESGVSAVLVLCRLLLTRVFICPLSHTYVDSSPCLLTEVERTPYSFDSGGAGAAAGVSMKSKVSSDTAAASRDILGGMLVFNGTETDSS